MINTTNSHPVANRGDVVLVLFPNSDLRTAKRRPALVIQADNLETGLAQIVVAMISSRMFRAGHSSRVPVFLNTPEGTKSGLLTDSVIMTDNLATVLLIAIEKKIGSVPMQKIDAALR
jgi:mRNA interferase MazF